MQVGALRAAVQAKEDALAAAAAAHKEEAARLAAQLAQAQAQIQVRCLHSDGCCRLMAGITLLAQQCQAV